MLQTNFIMNTDSLDLDSQQGSDWPYVAVAPEALRHTCPAHF